SRGCWSSAARRAWTRSPSPTAGRAPSRSTTVRCGPGRPSPSPSSAPSAFRRTTPTRRAREPTRRAWTRPCWTNWRSCRSAAAAPSSARSARPPASSPASDPRRIHPSRIHPSRIHPSSAAFVPGRGSGAPAPALRRLLPLLGLELLELFLEDGLLVQDAVRPRVPRLPSRLRVVAAELLPLRRPLGRVAVGEHPGPVGVQASLLHAAVVVLVVPAFRVDLPGRRG